MLPSTLTKLIVQQVAKEAVALLFVKAAPAGVVVAGGLVQMTDFRVAASGWMNMKPQMEASGIMALTFTKLTVQQVAQEAVALLFVKAASAGVVVEGVFVQMADFRVAGLGVDEY